GRGQGSARRISQYSPALRPRYRGAAGADRPPHQAYGAILRGVSDAAQLTPARPRGEGGCWLTCRLVVGTPLVHRRTLDRTVSRIPMKIRATLAMTCFVTISPKKTTE